MPGYEHYHDTVHWHMSEITSRIIAQSGIPSDRFHIGKIILQCLKDNPDLVAQIVGSTGESETNRSLLQRTIQCAIGLTKLGVKKGDIIIITAPNHLDIVVPLYAALYLGIIIAPISWRLNKDFAKYMSILKPKIVFCQSDKSADMKLAIEEQASNPKIITFDKGNGDMNFSDVLQLGEDREEIAKFRPTDLDPSEAIAMLISTSGSTGFPKLVTITHKSCSLMAPYFWSCTIEIPPFQRVLFLTPFWSTSALRIFLSSTLMKFTRVQTMPNQTPEHIYELINKYKPTFMTTNTIQIMALMRGNREKCDFTCIERITLGGSPVPPKLLEEMKKVLPKTEILVGFGMTELFGRAFAHGFSTPPESCGKPIGCLQYRLVDEATGRDINEPNVIGELWLKGPGLTKGYYNNPESTQAAFEEGWFKTGDLLYRDANWNFYFKDRMKFLIKHNHYQISPLEIEAVIAQHPGVLDIAVTAIRVSERWELPVACVVAAPSGAPTAQDIQKLVKETLDDNKQLRGGVIFLDQLPLTVNFKVDRRKLKDMAYLTGLKKVNRTLEPFYVSQ